MPPHCCTIRAERLACLGPSLCGLHTVYRATPVYLWELGGCLYRAARRCTCGSRPRLACWAAAAAFSYAGGLARLCPPSRCPPFWFSPVPFVLPSCSPRSWAYACIVFLCVVHAACLNNLRSVEMLICCTAGGGGWALALEWVVGGRPHGSGGPRVALGREPGELVRAVRSSTRLSAVHHLLGCPSTTCSVQAHFQDARCWGIAASSSSSSVLLPLLCTDAAHLHLWLQW